MMAQRALVRRVAFRFPDQPDLRRVEPFRHRDLGLFFTRHHRLERQDLIEHLLAAAMDRAHRGADIGVIRAIDLLADEVDEPAFALEQRE
jgi:hypothetical protein